MRLYDANGTRRLESCLCVCSGTAISALQTESLPDGLQRRRVMGTQNYPPNNPLAKLYKPVKEMYLNLFKQIVFYGNATSPQVWKCITEAETTQLFRKHVTYIVSTVTVCLSEPHIVSSQTIVHYSVRIHFSKYNTLSHVSICTYKRYTCQVLLGVVI